MDLTKDFSKTGYVLLQNIIEKDEVERLYKYTLENMHRGNLNDGQVIGSPAFYQDKEIPLLQNKLLPKFEEAINLAQGYGSSDQVPLRNSLRLIVINN